MLEHSVEEIREHFVYCGGSLYRSRGPNAGARAGTNSKNGRTIKFGHKFYYEHRLIWLLFYGALDDEVQIVHLDGNVFNNSIDNLAMK